MAPAVPFALLGVVQMLAVAGWLGLAGAAAFPRLRRRVTPLFMLGALAMAAAAAAIAVALVQLSRANLIGKLAGAILAGVVAMSAGAVGVVGTGVASQVAQQQEQRLLQVAHGGQQTLLQLSTRAAFYANVVVVYPHDKARAVLFLKTFSDQPDYFGSIVTRTGTVLVVAHPAP